MNWEQIRLLLEVVGETRDLPRLKAIHDEAAALLEDQVPKAAEAQEKRRVEAANAQLQASARAEPVVVVPSEPVVNGEVERRV